VREPCPDRCRNSRKWPLLRPASTTGTTGRSAKAFAVESSPSFRGRHSHCHRNYGWGRPHRHCGFDDGDGSGDGGDGGDDE
jgi:hypothetical protein